MADGIAQPGGGLHDRIGMPRPQLQPHRHRIDEEADQVRQGRMIAAGGHRCQHDILPAGGLCDRPSHTGEQSGEQAAVAGRGSGPQPVDTGGRQRTVPNATAMGPDRTADGRTGQVEGRGRIAQCPGPVGRRGGVQGGVEAVRGRVAVLDGQCREIRCRPGAFGPHQGQQLPNHHFHRPDVGDGMVDAQH